MEERATSASEGKEDMVMTKVKKEKKEKKERKKEREQRQREDRNRYSRLGPWLVDAVIRMASPSPPSSSSLVAPSFSARSPSPRQSTLSLSRIKLTMHSGGCGLWSVDGRTGDAFSLVRWCM